MRFTAPTTRRNVFLDIETVSLHPEDEKGARSALTGRIVCICLLFDDGQQITEETLVNQDEAFLLSSFWSLIRTTDVFVGHNVFSFDLPFIRQRCWILGVRPSRRVDLRRGATRAFAVADGATEASASRYWARLLAKSWVRSPSASQKHAFLDLAHRLGERTTEKWGKKKLPWYAEEKAKAGSYAAFAGVTFDVEDIGLGWRALAIGDCCLIQTRSARPRPSCPRRQPQSTYAASSSGFAVTACS